MSPPLPPPPLSPRGIKAPNEVPIVAGSNLILDEKSFVLLLNTLEPVLQSVPVLAAFVTLFTPPVVTLLGPVVKQVVTAPNPVAYTIRILRSLVYMSIQVYRPDQVGVQLILFLRGVRERPEVMVGPVSVFVRNVFIAERFFAG